MDQLDVTYTFLNRGVVDEMLAAKRGVIIKITSTHNPCTLQASTNSPRHLHLARVEHLLSARHHPPPTHRPGHIALRYSNRYTQSGPAKWYSGHLPRTHGSVVFARDGCPPYCDAVRTTGGESTSRADRVGSGFLGVRNVPADATDGRKGDKRRGCG